jgi:WD40 repeat protein
MAAAPTELVNGTVRAALLFASNQTAAAGLISAPVAALTEGVLKAMLVTKLKIVTAVMLTVGVVGSGAGMLTYRAMAGQPVQVAEKQPNDEGAKPPQAKRPKEAKSAAWRERVAFEKQKHPVQTLAFSPDGKRLATGSADGAMMLWDVASGKVLLKFDGMTGGAVSAVAFSPDGKLIAKGGINNEDMPPTGEVILLDAASGKMLAKHTGQKDRVASVAFSPDGKFLAAGVRDGTVRLWEAKTNKAIYVFKWNSQVVNGIAFSPDGKTLATAGSKAFLRSGDQPAEVKLWDVRSGKELRALVIHARAALGVAFSPDGKTLAVAGGEQEATVWDAATGKKIIELIHTGGRVRCLAWSPDGKILASGDGPVIRLWDVATGKVVIELKVGAGQVHCIAFAPDGKRLATGSGKPGKDGVGEVKIWELNALQNAKPDRAQADSPNVGDDRLKQLLSDLLKSKRTDVQVLEALYLATLARLPNEAETKFALSHVTKQGNRAEGFADVLWTLTNTKEFAVNVEAMNKRLPRRP